MSVLIALSCSHMLNDTIQALIPAMYPVLKQSYALTFTEIGLITFTFQVSSSLLQPMVGLYTDRRPKPYSLAAGMCITLAGLLLLAAAGSFPAILAAAAIIGAGSSIFHPEASRLAHLAAGNRHGFAQSLFQVGGNFGGSLGPLLAAWIIVPRGQGSVAWFSIVACMGIALLTAVGRWYGVQLRHGRAKAKTRLAQRKFSLSRGKTWFTLGVLVVLMSSKFFYTISLTNYYTFYLIHKFGVSVQQSQVYLFIFLFATAAGTIAGGPLGDRFGRKAVIWVSILGAAPFSLALPHMGLAGTVVLSVFAGLILASAFSTILVFAQELVPGRVGLIAGLFFGFAFGISGVASAVLGRLADYTSIEYVFQICAWLPLIGLAAAFLPSTGKTVRA
ncbi:MAG: MFS transporter [Candidatus Hydrogenedentes bacterium]|nr:MFS transporter [Candidatus Hydrogenedentota bacterium]